MAKLQYLFDNQHSISFPLFFFQPVLPRRLHSLVLPELDQQMEKILVLHMIMEIKLMQRNLGSYRLFTWCIGLIGTKVMMIIMIVFNTVLLNLFNLNVNCIKYCLHSSIISAGYVLFRLLNENLRNFYFILLICYI